MFLHHPTLFDYGHKRHITASSSSSTQSDVATVLLSLMRRGLDYWASSATIMLGWAELRDGVETYRRECVLEADFPFLWHSLLLFV